MLKRPSFIRKEVFDKLSRKQQDYLCLLAERKHTKSEIKRKLYIKSDTTFRRFRKKIDEILQNEMKVINKLAKAVE